MLAGASLGIPLTLLQLWLHPTGVAFDAPQVANNVLLGMAVYGNDRIEGPFNAPERLPGQLAALGSAAFYASQPETLPLVPVVLALHTSYSRIKPSIGPVKPFLVASLWTVAVCYAPVWHSGAASACTNVDSASFFLAISALSHALDVYDAEEDELAGVRTPAVLMGRGEAQRYALTLAFASGFLNLQGPHASLPFDVGVLCAARGVSVNETAAWASLAGVCVAAYAWSRRLEIVVGLLRSSNALHSWSIEALVHASSSAVRSLPPDLAHAAQEALFYVANEGDELGGSLLRVYQELIRGGSR